MSEKRSNFFQNMQTITRRNMRQKICGNRRWLHILC